MALGSDESPVDRVWSTENRIHRSALALLGLGPALPRACAHTRGLGLLFLGSEPTGHGLQSVRNNSIFYALETTEL